MAVALVWWLRPRVDVASVVRGTAVQAVPATVTVRAAYAMELRSETGGRIKSSTLVLGHPVKAGAVLIEIDEVDLRIEESRLEDELASAGRREALGSPLELELANARAGLAAFVRSTEAGSYAPVELEKQQRLVEQIERKIALETVDRAAERSTLENALAVQRRTLEKTRVIAPIDGVVTAIEARPGDLIGAGAPLATIVADERIVEARISEEKFAGVAAGQKAVVRFLGYGAEQFTATVAQVLPTADPDTQRYTVQLEVDIPRERLVPGLSGEASIIAGERQGVLLIPRRALLGDYILVVKDGRVQQRRVQRGYESLDLAEIITGVAEDERVITDRLDTFEDGDRVRVP